MTMQATIQARPYDEFDLRSAPPARTTTLKAPVAAVGRYIQMRRLALGKTHQQALHTFLQDYGRSYGSAKDATDAYFARFQAVVKANQERANETRKQIMADRNMDFVRKQQAISRLAPAMDCAWPQAREDGFHGQYGDVRADVALWNTELAMLDRTSYEVNIDQKTVTREATNWERMVPWLLAHPELDGSVAPCVTIQKGPAPMVDRAFTQQVFAPVAGPEVDPKYYEAMLQAGKAVCPHCLLMFPKGWKQHERSCAVKHKVQSVQDVELPDDLPMLMRREVPVGVPEPEVEVEVGDTDTDEFEDTLPEQEPSL